MSLFVQQNNSFSDFTKSDPWIILSPIEQSIKDKIEKVGTPLKQWDIEIYRGVLTGCNDAFIITSNQRDSILTNCKNREEYKRTEDIIRPILRGRDIKRYGYDWEGLWLIATFPSRHYNIDNYPALKAYLLSFGKRRLEQSGEMFTLNGEIVKSRKKTKNKWFETQDSISYWEDFSKPKIIWKRIGSILRFAYDTNGYLGLDSTCFATSEKSAYICCVLNSHLGHYMLEGSPKTGTGDLLVSVQAVEPIRIPLITSQKANEFEKMIMEEPIDDEKINNSIYELYGLDLEEIKFIEQF